MKSKPGVVLRILYALGGSALGLALVWLGWFGASFENSSPVWDGEATTLLILGAAVIVATVYASIKPTVRNATVSGLVIALVPVAGGIL